MPSLIDLRRRVRAVKSTQQITKAMKMVSASKLRRAQDRALSARPFSQRMLQVLNDLVPHVDRSAHPLLALPDERRAGSPALYVIVTADRGLCGSFNTNIIKAAAKVMTESAGRKVAVALVGKKGRDFFSRRGLDVRFELVGLFSKLGYSHAQAIAQLAIEDFSTGRFEGVYLIYNEFKSVLQQRIVVDRLLPIGEIEGGQAPPASGVDYLYEPAPERIFAKLLPRYVETQAWRALLESAAAEQAARMTAMDAATKNAVEMIDQLTLYMNKVRQANITREIIEVVSGAGAL